MFGHFFSFDVISKLYYFIIYIVTVFHISLEYPANEVAVSPIWSQFCLMYAAYCENIVYVQP